MASTEQQPQQQQQQSQQQPQQQQPQQQDIDSPVIAPAHASQGGREVNKKVLYVGGVDQNVTEEMLLELFKVTGNVTSIKIFPDKNRRGLNYAFVEYDDSTAAELAFSTLDRRVLNQSEITINWAYQTQQTTRDPEYFNIFVGDLSSEVNDEFLSKAFSVYGNMVEARVMWDMTTGRSRGYGFVSFSDRASAEQGLNSMNGEWLGSRTIRCNWASQKQQFNGGNYHNHHNNHYHNNSHNNGGNNSHNSNGFGNNNPNYNKQQHFHQQQQQNMGMMNPNSYDMVLRQTPNWQTTVYVGNLAPFTGPNDLISLLQNFGYIVDFKYQQERGYAFVKYENHERAAMAITNLANAQINGRPLRVGWGKSN
ncbi:hypothetical protein D0Z03_002072 [Geotrichum reessii]|nr:hypothetical protein D0Z03_002072 [Galactomyces reessii]